MLNGQTFSSRTDKTSGLPSLKSRPEGGQVCKSVLCEPLVKEVKIGGK